MVVVGAAVVITAVAAAPVVAAAAAGTASGAGATVTATVSASGAATVTATAGSGAGASATAAAVSASALGPVGWFALGASDTCTFDCWKPVLRDESAEPSCGRLLRDVAADGRVKLVVTDNSGPLPRIVLHNIWDEQFLIEYVTLPSKQIALHATRFK